jgi:hypothetical protein
MLLFMIVSILGLRSRVLIGEEIVWERRHWFSTDKQGEDQVRK